ncbi:hypothetical protein JCM8097_009243 [Rhodosporidiobolus ruineniae]
MSASSRAADTASGSAPLQAPNPPAARAASSKCSSSSAPLPPHPSRSAVAEDAHPAPSTAAPVSAALAPAPAPATTSSASASSSPEETNVQPAADASRSDPRFVLGNDGDESSEDGNAFARARDGGPPEAGEDNDSSVRIDTAASMAVGADDEGRVGSAEDWVSESELEAREEKAKTVPKEVELDGLTPAQLANKVSKMAPTLEDFVLVFEEYGKDIRILVGDPSIQGITLRNSGVELVKILCEMGTTAASGLFLRVALGRTPRPDRDYTVPIGMSSFASAFSFMPHIYEAFAKGSLKEAQRKAFLDLLALHDALASETEKGDVRAFPTVERSAAAEAKAAKVVKRLSDSLRAREEAAKAEMLKLKEETVRKVKKEMRAEFKAVIARMVKVEVAGRRW